MRHAGPMEIRDPAMPDRPQRQPQPRAAPVDSAAGAAPVDSAAGAAPVESVRYRVDPRFTAVMVGGFVIFALAALAFHDDRPELAFTGVAALVVAGYAVRDLIAPVRLVADREGVTVISGYAGKRRVEGDEI